MKPNVSFKRKNDVCDPCNRNNNVSKQNANKSLSGEVMVFAELSLVRLQFNFLIFWVTYLTLFPVKVWLHAVLMVCCFVCIQAYIYSIYCSSFAPLRTRNQLTQCLKCMWNTALSNRHFTATHTTRGISSNFWLFPTNVMNLPARIAFPGWVNFAFPAGAAAARHRGLGKGLINVPLSRRK